MLFGRLDELCVTEIDFDVMMDGVKSTLGTECFPFRGSVYKESLQHVVSPTSRRRSEV